MKKRHVAFLGTMGSGKTTFAELLELKGFKRISFATKVKEIAYDLFFMDPKVKDRVVLQGIGMKMREIRPDVWIDYLIKNHVILSTNQSPRLVVDDCRFVNEVKALQENGFFVIGLVPDEGRRLARLRHLYGEDIEKYMGDSSETDVENALALCDVVIREQVGPDGNSVEPTWGVVKEVINNNLK